MVEQVKDVPAYIRKMYGFNSFMNTFGVHIDEITCGGAVVSINIDPQKHFNHRGMAVFSLRWPTLFWELPVLAWAQQWQP